MKLPPDLKPPPERHRVPIQPQAHNVHNLPKIRSHPRHQRRYLDSKGGKSEGQRVQLYYFTGAGDGEATGAGREGEGNGSEVEEEEEVDRG